MHSPKRCTRRPVRFAGALAAVLMAVQPLQAAAAQDRLADPAEILEAISESPFEEPIHLVSDEERNRIQGDVHAILDVPLTELGPALGSAKAWCEFLILHFNVKACVHQDGGNAADITLYMGRKHYQDPEVVDQLHLEFLVEQVDDERVALRLRADDGPHGLHELRMDVQAVALDGDTSLLHLHYSFGWGALGRMTLGVYLAFGGRNRIGFTITEHDEDGEPVYVDGLRGMIERNTVRYLFALKAFLEAPEPERMENRLHRWFDLTERYPAQLREMDRDRYIAQKLREYGRQAELQARADGSG